MSSERWYWCVGCDVFGTGAVCWFCRRPTLLRRKHDEIDTLLSWVDLNRSKAVTVV